MDSDARPTIDFDHHSPVLSKDPYGTYRELRRKCPVAYSTQWGGFWVLSKYRDVVAVAHDDETFASKFGVTIPHVGQLRPLIPIEIDPPEFHHYRRLINPPFTSAAVSKYESDMREIARNLIGAFQQRGTCDVVREYARPFPAIMFMRLLGFPDDRWSDFQNWMDIVGHQSAADPAAGAQAAGAIYSELQGAIDDRRRHEGEGRDDLISYLVSAKVEGRSLTDEEILDFCFLLQAGGLDTTASAIGNSIHYLARHPEARDQLLNDPELMPAATEEFLRYEGPLHSLARTATKDTVLGGQKIKEGEKLLLLWASANRDEDEFPDADSVCFDRAPNRHVAFGIGIHRCLGSNLGRLELRVALEEFLRAMPEFTVKPGSELVPMPDVSTVYGLQSLELQWLGGPLNGG